MAKRVAFLHPDLGIGGAEQLVVSLALALRSKGYEVKIYTPYHDPQHCFPETADGTLQVEVRGHWFPRTIFGRGVALCAYIRMLLATLFVVMYGGWFDAIVVDQVSAVMPLLKLSRAKAVFYCHYPDKLLSTDRRSMLKRLYRKPLDALEGFGLKTADTVLVNSRFTKGVVERAFGFPVVNNLQILYPSVVTNLPSPLFQSFPETLTSVPYFLSLNRYERKKNIGLAIQAFAQVSNRGKARLVIAGGYDSRLPENVDYFQDLIETTKTLNLKSEVADSLKTVETAEVVFLRNVKDGEKDEMIRRCTAVLYTPENEHFGIVPLEAMVREKPVLASNSGGPTETVENSKTGYLLSTDPKDWARSMEELLASPDLVRTMSANARIRVAQNFSFNSMAGKLQEIIG